MNLYDLVKNKKEEILKLAEKHGAYNVRVFGSVIRDEATEESDIDFLVDFSGVDLYDYADNCFDWSGFNCCAGSGFVLL